MRYRQRPLEIDAIRWTGENVAEIAEFTRGNRSVAHDPSSHSLFVTNAQGQARCMAGDWVVLEDGVYYAYPAILFDKTYEAIDALEAV